jgi:hypothetical protein
MADRDDARKVEIVARRLIAQRVGGRRGVEKGSGITAAGTVDAAIVDVPDGDAADAQILGDPVHQCPVGDVGLPAAAVDHQHDGMGAGALGQPQVDDLQRVLAIAYRRRRLRAQPFQQVLPDHQAVGATGFAVCRHRASR